jgi:RNA polymerase sigma-70 factor (ECF subfamily)
VPSLAVSDALTPTGTDAQVAAATAGNARASGRAPVAAPRAPVASLAARREQAAAEGGATYSFESVYEEHFAFVWRSVRRLGVVESAVDDAVQEIFVVVHRRLPEYEERGSLKSWLYGIVLRVVRVHRRTLRRKPAQLGGSGIESDVDTVSDHEARGPHERAAKNEAVRVLHEILDELDDEKREVFVLAELEQLTVPEIAELVDANLNTVYSRLRAARREFEQGVARHRARDEWRSR